MAYDTFLVRTESGQQVTVGVEELLRIMLSGFMPDGSSYDGLKIQGSGSGGVVEITQDAAAEQTFTIGSGADGSAVDPVDLGAAYDLIWVRCEDCSGIDASTNLSALVKHASGDTLCDLYEQDDPSTQWSAGAIPATGTMAFLLSHAAGIRYLRLVLSNVSTADVVFGIKGFHRSE